MELRQAPSDIAQKQAKPSVEVGVVQVAVFARTLLLLLVLLLVQCGAAAQVRCQSRHAGMCWGA